MTRRRKNAGEGYGYMFHGSFSSKKDAQTKERTRKGAFIKTTYIKGERRYTVMSPRTNPIKRKKKAIVPAANPSELVVMGANPHNHTIELPPNSTITIRTNPTGELAQNGILSSIGSFLHDKTYAGKLALAEHRSAKRDRKAGKWARMSREKRRNLVIAAGVSPSIADQWAKMKFADIPEGWRDAIMARLNPLTPNPSAPAIRESFTGAPADSYTVENEPHMPRGDYAQLGELLALYVKPVLGGQVQKIDFQHDRPLLVSDESARQLYFVGGDQDVVKALGIFTSRPHAGLVELGEVRRIDYKQRKEHVPHPDRDEWRHDLGEETGVRPHLYFDTASKRLSLQGGEYVVRAEGIVN